MLMQNVLDCIWVGADDEGTWKDYYFKDESNDLFIEGQC
jgi:hypothetical protein